MEEELNLTKYFYKIGEVADIIGEPASTIRTWSDEFTILKPQRNNKQNRMFRQEDIRNLKTIQYLIRERKMTHEGVKLYLKDRNKAEKEQNMTEILLGLKAELQSIYDALDND